MSLQVHDRTGLIQTFRNIYRNEEQGLQETFERIRPYLIPATVAGVKYLKTLVKA